MRLLFVLCLVILLQSCASKKIENIEYLQTESLKITVEGEHPALNVFHPRKQQTNQLPVYLFVHGGNWNAGKKETYGFVGRNFAKHDVVTVIPGYTLSPNANYDTMARQIAEAYQWTVENIAAYGGDPNNIYLSGHSAGGHLVALIATNPEYVENPQHISGLILNDAAALDMYDYLQNYPPKPSNNYDTTWTLDPSEWKNASPIYFLDNETPPMLIYIGKKTYRSIWKYNHVFLEELNKFQPDVSPIILDKKHIPMMSQMFWPWNQRYDEMVEFMTNDR